MRTSKRDQVVAAALGIVEKQGVEALSFEGLAAATGLSKSGILYHFPSRHQLLLALHQHVAKEWEKELIAVAGAPAADLTPEQRLRAVVLTTGANAQRAELLLILSAHDHPDFDAVRWEIDRQWMPEDNDTAAYLIQLLADGLWLHDHVHHNQLSENTRRALLDAVLALIPES